MLVLVPKITNRLHYIFDFVFRERLGVPFQLTTDAASFRDFDGPTTMILILRLIY